MPKKLYIDKLIIGIIIINLAEIATIGAALVLTGIDRTGIKLLTSPGILVIVLSALAAIIINTLVAINNRVRILRADSDNRLVRDSLSKLEHLNNTLRSQRHDFMNHLQVVYSLMEMEEFSDASDYIEKVYADIQKVSRVMKTSSPAVNALLQAKILACEKKGISVNLDVTTQLRDMPIPAWEFCRVLGNIVDNAIYALTEKNDAQRDEKHGNRTAGNIDVKDVNNAVRKLNIQLFEDLKNFGFRISNNGPSIPEEHLSRIFESGYTTKGEKGEGMGLSISKELLEEHGGWLNARSSDEITVFEGSIPKQQ